MPRTKCCCDIPTFESFCCNPVFFKDFITLFGDSMSDHAEVSPKDWVALAVPRPRTPVAESRRYSEEPTSCNCCCDCPPHENNSWGACQGQGENEQIPCNADIIAWCEGVRDLSAEEHKRCERACCKGDYIESFAEGSEDIYFAYKYSGCNLLWYPREYTFGHNPYISQCNGFLTRRTDDQATTYNSQNSCQPFANQRTYAGAAIDTFVQTWCDGVLPQARQINPQFPCACVPFPHIHGGVRDSVFNRINVRLTQGQMGFVSHMVPFSPPMLSFEEAGCCWCASNGVPNQDEEALIKNRAANYLGTYPFFDQQGKSPTQSNTNGVGTYCYDVPGLTDNGQVARNPNYRKRCYEWGLSPYLLRISQDSYKAGYEIWRHGRNSAYTHDFGPLYIGTEVKKKDLSKEYEIKFRKLSGVKSTLREQYIGFVQLEHHFEIYAYRSDDASKVVNMLAVQNHCTLLIPPFERGYFGSYSPQGGNKVLWKPWNYDSILWQVKRGVPRRVMYQGSGVPLFGFDLTAMERLCEQNPDISGPEGVFDPITFLEHYNRYYFSMIGFFDGSCENFNSSPGPFEWNFDHLLRSYEYVRGWIEQMIVHGIVRIKDHAIDIAKNVNQIVQSGTYDSNGDVIVADVIAQETGGLSGYKDILTFFGVCAGTSSITPKMIKQKLLNDDGLVGYTGPSGDMEYVRCFLPRKATLPVGATRTGLTAWGCSGPLSATGNSYSGITCESYIDDARTIPALLNDRDPNSVFSNLSPIALESGLGGTFVIDNSGKISVFGGIPEDGDSACTDSGTFQYPSSISCIPYYLSIFGLFNFNSQPISLLDRTQIPDGKVIDLSFKGKNFAVALLDFDNGGIGSSCTVNFGEQGNEPSGNSANEDDANPGNENYDLKNCNGVNVGAVGSGVLCFAYEPFQLLSVGGSSILGPRSDQGEQRPTNAYRLKSWGSQAKRATFSLAYQDAARPGFSIRGYDEEINPNNLRYPGTNTWFIWTNISSGMNHFCAIDDFGGVFSTPLSDNSHGQCDKGIPLTYQEAYERGYVGYAKNYHYYNHIPRPGYIKPEEWTIDLYDSLTKLNSAYRTAVCACPTDSTENCHSNPPGGGGGENTENCNSIAIQIRDENGVCQFPTPPVYDITCNLMGSLVQTPGAIQDIIDSQPKYISLACGHYNTLLLTNENRLEIYGRYYQIDQNGNITGPVITTTVDGQEQSTLGISAFVPQGLLDLQGTWNLTYGCTFICDGVTHSPILGATYNAPSTNNTINFIDSGPDYSICSVGSNRIYVWGDVSMCPNSYTSSYETYVPGSTAADIISFNTAGFEDVNIQKIVAGVNAFYVYYTQRIPNTNFSASKIYSWTRYGRDNNIFADSQFGLSPPSSIQSKPIVDISAGNAHAVVIYGDGIEAKKWDYQSFAPGTQKYQYKNWNSIPDYFKRDAFFHAIPGGWDFSKWLYGGNCCTKMDDPGHPCLKQDPCSALAYNIYEGNTFNKNLAYSGNPHYFWMRKDWRRFTTQSFNIYKNQAFNDVIPCETDGSQIGGNLGGNAVSSIYGGCLRDVGSVWGEGRPLANTIIRNTIRKIQPPCQVTGDDSCYGASEFFVSGTIPDDVASFGPNTDFPPKVSYRATKDLFQMMTSRYQMDDFGDDGSIPCAKFSQAPISTFRYSERHYYFGYDRETDTWDIYENPDFLHKISPNFILNCPVPIESYATNPELCPQGYTFIGITFGSGFGGGTGLSGSTMAGMSGYYSLYDYPLTGPNYPTEKYVYTPAYVPDNFYIYRNIIAAYCNLFSVDNECYRCGLSPGRTVAQRIQYFAGRGAFVWLPACEGQSTNPEEIYRMWAPYFYLKTIVAPASAEVMLKGVRSQIDFIIPPDQDPNFVKFDMSKVLMDPEFTETINPWYYGQSKKWIPMCYEPSNYFENICGLSGYNTSAVCFAGTDSDDVEVTGNVVTYTCQGGIVFYSSPVTCNVFDCCPPPPG